MFPGVSLLNVIIAPVAKSTNMQVSTSPLNSVDNRECNFPINEISECFTEGFKTKTQNILPPTHAVAEMRCIHRIKR